MEHDGDDPVRQLFDQLGDAEWQRLDTDARAWVAFEIHRRFLRRFVPAGGRVLEI